MQMRERFRRKSITKFMVHAQKKYSRCTIAKYLPENVCLWLKISGLMWYALYMDIHLQ